MFSFLTTRGTICSRRSASMQRVDVCPAGTAPARLPRCGDKRSRATPYRPRAGRSKRESLYLWPLALVTVRGHVTVKCDPANGRRGAAMDSVLACGCVPLERELQSGGVHERESAEI